MIKVTVWGGLIFCFLVLEGDRSFLFHYFLELIIDVRVGWSGLYVSIRVKLSDSNPREVGSKWPIFERKLVIWFAIAYCVYDLTPNREVFIPAYKYFKVKIWVWCGRDGKSWCLVLVHFVVRSHIGRREERTIPYKGVETPFYSRRVLIVGLSPKNYLY